MKANPILHLGCIVFLALQTVTALASPPMDTDTATIDDFSAVGSAVADLLKSRDVKHFVAEMAPTAEDFSAIMQTNSLENNPHAYASGANRTVKASAEALLARADSLHLNFSDSNLTARVVSPENPTRIYFGSNPRDDENANGGAPYVQRLEIVLTPGTNAAPSPNGDFKIAITGLIKFPSGWKVYNSVLWADFPSNVAGEKVRHELAILQKANDGQGLTAQDDPGLLQLADSVVHFIRARDIHPYQQDAMARGDDMFALAQKLANSQGPQRPTQADFLQKWNPQQQEWLKAAETALDLMKQSGIDLTDAQIQVTSASTAGLQPPMGTASGLDGMVGQQFQIQFTVKSGGKSKNGTSLDGDYTLTAGLITRLGNNWKIIGDLRWDQMPAGILDAKADAKMEFESYVAKNNTLPPGTKAPEIEFTRLDNGQKMKLSDLRGKIVVLDFWATWCGPCQEPMAHLQTLREQNPDWKDRVAIVPLSIDDTIDVIRHHVETRGWTNTFNVWAGDGGWQSSPAQAFRVRAVPTTYIIGPHGIIVKAGHPAAMNIDDEVNNLLNVAKE